MEQEGRFAECARCVCAGCGCLLHCFSDYVESRCESRLSMVLISPGSVLPCESREARSSS